MSRIPTLVILAMVWLPGCIINVDPDDLHFGQLTIQECASGTMTVAEERNAAITLALKEGDEQTPLVGAVELSSDWGRVAPARTTVTSAVGGRLSLWFNRAGHVKLTVSSQGQSASCQVTVVQGSWNYIDRELWNPTVDETYDCLEPSIEGISLFSAPLSVPEGEAQYHLLAMMPCTYDSWVEPQDKRDKSPMPISYTRLVHAYRLPQDAQPEPMPAKTDAAADSEREPTAVADESSLWRCCSSTVTFAAQAWASNPEVLTGMTLPSPQDRLTLLFSQGENDNGTLTAPHDLYSWDFSAAMLQELFSNGGSVDEGSFRQVADSPRQLWSWPVALPAKSGAELWLTQAQKTADDQWNLRSSHFALTRDERDNLSVKQDGRYGLTPDSRANPAESNRTSVGTVLPDVRGDGELWRMWYVGDQGIGYVTMDRAAEETSWPRRAAGSNDLVSFEPQPAANRTIAGIRVIRMENRYLMAINRAIATGKSRVPAQKSVYFATRDVDPEPESATVNAAATEQ